jgi:dienelactone hydrolase
VAGTSARKATTPARLARALAAPLLLLLLLLLMLALSSTGAVAGVPARSPALIGGPPAKLASSTGGQEAAPTPVPSPVPTAPPGPPLAVGLRVLRLVDPSRRIRLPNGSTRARTLLTYVRYPALGPPAGTDVLDAPAATGVGPYPLVVFGHGFAVTPRTYAHLLQSLTRAGYIVAAPEFPLGSADAPGGPDESDLINQPADMSFTISRVLAAGRAAAGPLAGVIDPAHIAVAGQSDGAMTALAVAYSRRFRDRRVSAALVMSGAEMGGVGGFAFGRGAPPLLAIQGSADTINEPRFTYAFFGAARHPKYLLRLLGAGHLPPYTREQPQLAIVERVSIAFLDGYLRHSPSALALLPSLGSVPKAAALLSAP